MRQKENETTPDPLADNRLGIGNASVAGKSAVVPSPVSLVFFLIFLRNLTSRRRHFVWLSQYPGLCSGTARTEEFRSSKFGTGGMSVPRLRAVLATV
jgi:hypothetical protein